MRQRFSPNFWDNVNKDGPNGCWDWIGAPNGQGYGQIRGERAHRVAWELTHGPITDGRWVLHHCDRPICVNPAHLFLGTCKDNVRDCISKGRFRAGGGPKTECKRGHAYTPENTYVNGKGRKICRECHRVRESSRYDRDRLNGLPPRIIEFAIPTHMDLDSIAAPAGRSA